MCPAKLNKQPGKPAQSKVFKKSQQKKDKKKGRGKNFANDESNVEEEQQPEEMIDDKSKQDSWLYNLPPVIKPDEELHQELTKKRKEITRQKHINICKEEANSILNYVFSAIDAKDDPKKITRLKIDFLNGKFIPKIEIQNEEENSNKCPISSIKSNLSIEELLQPKNTDLKDSLESLYKEINFSCQFDANPELNSVLQQLQISMTPYTKPSSLPEPVDFPFVVCVTGPPHSGKTSICQFIHKFFNTYLVDVIFTANSGNSENTNEEEEQKIEEEEEKKIEKSTVIKSSDDKIIINKISEILPKIESNCGLLIRNYPLNKGQAALLEKALNTYGKQKQNQTSQTLNSNKASQNQNASKGNQGNLIQSQSTTKSNLSLNRPTLSSIRSNLSQYLNNQNIKQDPSQMVLKTINCVFRTALSAEEAQAQVAGRLVNVETGEIFHEKFRPPSVLDDSESIKAFVPQDLPINVGSYNKLLGLVSQLDILSKKGTIVVPIHLLDSTDKLDLQIENVLRQIYEGNNVSVPFSSFVHFRNLDQLKFAKFCCNVFDYWNDECIPIFGKALSKIYERIKIIKEKIDYLSECAKNQFLLNLLQKDKRNFLCDEFMKETNEERNYGQFFKEFWDISLMIREHQKTKIEEILNRCGLSKLKGVLNNREGEIFDALMKRFFIVEWYFKSFRTIDENSTKVNDGIPPLPILEFDLKDLNSLAKRIGINESLPIIYKKPTNKIIKPEVNKVEINKNSVSFGFKNRSVSQQKVVPPSFQKIHFLKPEKQDQNFTRSQSTLQEKTNNNMQLNSNISSSDQDQNSIENENDKNDIESSPRNSSSSMQKSNDKEKIEIFLKFLSEKLTVRVLRLDANILLSIFKYLMNEIEQIEESIDDRINGLRELMNKWINTKYSQEMEEFSEKFRKMKKEGQLDGSIFEISLNFKEEEEERDKFIKRLMPFLPSIDTSINFDKDKMIHLMNLIPKDVSVLSLKEILNYATEVGFSEEELAELEITITMSTIPDFVDVKEFGSSFTNDEII